MIDFLLNIFEKNKTHPAFAGGDELFYYSDILDYISSFAVQIKNYGLPECSVIAIEEETSGKSIALLLALIMHKAVCVPLTSTFESKKLDFLEISQAEFIIKIIDDKLSIKKTEHEVSNELILKLRNEKEPGLILFSSGTSGKSKAALHKLSNLLAKYKTNRKNLRTIAFMHFDHIGGFDTVFYSMSNASLLIFPKFRTPDSVCESIEKHKAEVLPVTPTFLNLLLLSESYKNYDLSSLKYITYGTEVMPEYLLKRCNEIFENVLFLQKYGTTEIGTLRSKSLAPDSPWVKIGGDGYQIRIVEGILQVKAESAMLGYLNAPSPFTEDGWYITGDNVEQNGEYIRILGRKTEIINVGGEKVYPQEVENTILEIKGTLDAFVFGKPNPLTGNIVCAEVSVSEEIEDSKAFAKEIKKYCSSKLPSFKVPVKIIISSEKQYSERFKKVRKRDEGNS